MPSRLVNPADASLREGLSELERPNLVFAGTSIVSGTGGRWFSPPACTPSSAALPTSPGGPRRTFPLTNRAFPVDAQDRSGCAGDRGSWLSWPATFDVGLGRMEAFLLAIGIIVAVIPEGPACHRHPFPGYGRSKAGTARGAGEKAGGDRTVGYSFDDLHR